MPYGNETLKALDGKRPIDKKKIYAELQECTKEERKEIIPVLITIEKMQKEEDRKAEVKR